MSKLLATLARLNAAPLTTQKEASASAPPHVEAEATEVLKKVAQALREMPPVEVSIGDLYAVLRGDDSAPIVIPPPSDIGDDPSHLHKVAHALRVLDAEREGLRQDKAADLLIAARGLTLMDEQTRTR